MGRLIAALDRLLLGELPGSNGAASRDPGAERRKGFLLVIIVAAATAAVTAAVMTAACRISPVVYVIAEAILTCYVLAQTSLRRESMKVYDELVKGDLSGARRAVSMIVGRDTEVLDEAGVTRAAVETVAENLSDGVIAPMFYTAIGGPVLGMTYKAVNTMDSMIGYKNDRYMWFGTAAAKLDDAANFIPSRISALLLIAASAVSGSGSDPKGACRIWRRDRRNHKSPNAAQTESAAAGALGLRLAGDAQYFGRIVSKPSIGDPVREIEASDIVRMNRLMMVSSLLGEVICLLIMLLLTALK